MTEQSAVLLIAFLAGLVVSAVLLRTATRNVLPGLQWPSQPGDPDLVSLFCFQPGPLPTCFQWISQYHAGRALVWLNVWRLHRRFFPCPRIYLWGRKKASNACLGLGDCRFPHTQFDRIHPLFCVPRASPWALQFCGNLIREKEAFCSHCGCSQGSSIGRIAADTRTI